MQRRRRPSTGTVLGLIALFVALGGTALAATGTLVNIADGTNAGNVAKVDANGALKTLQSETAPTKPFSIYATFYDAAYVQDNVVIPTTTATLAVSRINMSNWAGSPLRRTVLLFQYGLASGATCVAGGVPRIVGVYQIGPGVDARDEPNTPIIIKPLSGHPAWCLTAQSYPSGTSDEEFAYLNMTGFIVSGTLPAGLATGSAPPKQASKQPG